MKEKKIVTKTLNQILTFLFIFFLSTQLGKHFFSSFSYLSGIKVDYLAPTIYLTDIIAFLIILLNIKTLTKYLKKKEVLIFITLGLINTFFALSKPVALYYWLKISEWLLLFLIFKKVKVKKISYWNAFLFGTIIQVFLVTVQFINQKAIQGVFYFLGERFFNPSTPAIAKITINGSQFIRPYGTFSHPNSMAGFYLLIGIIALIYSKKLLFYLSFLLILISFSKLAIFTFGIIFFIYQFKRFNWKKNCLICWLAKLTLVLSLSLIFLSPLGDPTSLIKRLSLLKTSLLIINHHLLLGTGLGNYLIAQNNYSSSFLFLEYQPVHNIFLLGLAELGIIISLIFGERIFLFIKKYWSTSSLFRYLTIAILITGSFDHYWLTLQQNFLLLAVILPLAIAPHQSKTGSDVV